MEKKNIIKEKVSSIYSSMQEIVKKFPITILCIFVATISTVIRILFKETDILSKITTFTSIASIGILLSETITKSNSVFRIISYLLIAIISGFFTNTFSIADELTNRFLRILYNYINTIINLF